MFGKRFNRWLINFLMAGSFFNEVEKNIKQENVEWGIFETKTDYVNKVAKFLEDGVKEMKKDIKKF